MKQRRYTDNYVGFMMFDTLKAANEMKKAGITEEAAAAIVHAIYDSNKHVDISNLATKDDLSRLETSTKENFAKLETKLDASIKDLAKDMKDLAKEVKNLADSNVAIKATIGEIKYDILKWVIPIFLGIILAVFVKH